MLILGIETSCDETAAAIISSEREILANIVLSQIKEHTPYGGVVPEIAARAHVEAIDGVIAQALSQANVTLGQLDAVAVTGGPGLIGGVIVGVMTAKAIASVHKKPFIAVNHLEGHALTVRLTHDVAFPYLLLLVSGGHCQFIVAEDVGRYRRLGGTVDDALGEAFDKVAKMLDLGFPGGPAVERMARLGNPRAHAFPVPMKGRAHCDFSFSGLKTAVRLAIRELEATERLSEQAKADICASFQYTAVQSIRDRSEYAIAQCKRLYPEMSTLVIAGGVAANQYIRAELEMMAASHAMQLIAPPLKLCTDNAAMIAWAGIERMQRGFIDALTFEPRARWPLAEKSE